MQNPKLFILVLALFCFSEASYGQINGGLHAFESFALPPTARITAMGGSVIGVMDGDVALATQNPALTNKLMDHQLSVNQNFLFAGVSNTYLGYGKYFKKINLETHFGIQSNNYGSFTQADEIGNITGSFDASEIGFIIGTAKQLNERVRLGVNIKFASGSYETYTSSGIAADIGLLYGIQSDTTSQISFVIKNIGRSLSALGTENNPTPFDVQIGYSKKLAHLPFRFSVIAHNLHKWGIRYDDPNRIQTSNLFGEEEQTSAFNESVDNFFRHFIFAGAFLIGKKETVRLRFAYNHLRKQELELSNFRSLAGFSIGFGFSIKKIKFDYGVGYHHLAGGNNHLSLLIGLDKIFNKI